MSAHNKHLPGRSGMLTPFLAVVNRQTQLPALLELERENKVMTRAVKMKGTVGGVGGTMVRRDSG